MIEKLYQKSPKDETIWDNYGSFTLSRRSYDLSAKHEAVVLLRNGTVPNYTITLKYLVKMSASQIAELWSKHSDRLQRAGIVGRVAIEITKNKRRTRPVNRVHYHLAVQDTRTSDELIELVECVCLCEMPASSFQVHCKPIDNWQKRVWYFVKYKRPDNYLFRPNLPLQKFYTINKKKWWTYPDGRPRTRASIEYQIQLFAIAKHLKESERFIALQFPKIANERPTDYSKLKTVLDNEEAETLYDWYSILSGKPTVFHTEPPDWLLRTLPSQPRKCNDLFEALEKKLVRTDSIEVMYAMVLYH